MTKDWCAAISGGVRLVLQVAPNAKKTEVVAVQEDALKLRLRAPPVDGRANEALIRFVADVLDVPKAAVEITHGHTSKRKILEVHASQLRVEDVKQALESIGRHD